MDNMHVIGGIKAEIKAEDQDSAVEITLEDIVQNYSDSDGNPVEAHSDGDDFLHANQFENVTHDLGDEANARHDPKGQPRHSKRINNGKGKNNLRLDTGVQQSVNNDTDPEMPETLYLNYDSSDSEDSAILRCNHCYKVFDAKKYLLKHIRRMHRKVTKSDQCPYCPFTSKRSLDVHISMHKQESEIKLFKCDQCYFHTKMECHLRRHIRRIHGDVFKLDQCPYCPFTSKRDLDSHISMHKQESEIKLFKCDQCYYHTKQEWHLKRHMSTHVRRGGIECPKKSLANRYTEEDSAIFRCYHCHEVFYAKKHLLKHIRGMHREVTKSNQCPYCPFTSNRNLDVHISMHKQESEIKLFKCVQCYYHTKMEFHLRRHIRRIHGEVTKSNQCPYCPFTSKRGLDFHISMHKKESEIKLFKCDQCYYQTNLKANLSKHMLRGGRIKCPKRLLRLRQYPPPHLTTHTRDEADSIHQCDKCDYKTHKSSLFQGHELLHLRREEFQLFICYHCNFTSTGRDTFRRHIFRHFTKNEVTFQCYICDFTTMKRDILTVHILETHSKEAVKDMEINNGVQKKNKETALKNMLKNVKIIDAPTVYKEILANEYTHEGIRKFRCNHCHKVFKYRCALFRHIRCSHREVSRLYQCPYCPYARKFGLRDHIISMHLQDSEVKWFRCDQCDHKSKFKRNLQHHKLSHLHPDEMIDILIKCDKCPKLYKSQGELGNHIKLTHDRHKLKKKKCSECNSEFLRNNLLKHHMMEKHSNIEDLETLRCTKCSYTTKFQWILRRHLDSTHANTFQCEKCGYQTNRVYSFQVHQLNHLKPEEIQYFYCHHCDFKAKRKDNLKTHVLRHFKKNEVPFRCYICKFTTKRRNLLTNHLKKHSKGASVNKMKTEGDTKKEMENTIKKVDKGQKRNRATRVTPPVAKPLKQKGEADSPADNQLEDVDNVRSDSFDAKLPELLVTPPSDVATSNQPKEIQIWNFTPKKGDLHATDKHSKGAAKEMETDGDTMKEMSNTTKRVDTPPAAKPLKQKGEAASPADNQSEDVDDIRSESFDAITTVLQA